MLHYPYIPNSNEEVRKEMLDLVWSRSQWKKSMHSFLMK